MNRREFLYTGTAAIAARNLDASAYSAIAGANNRVGLAVIVTGKRAQFVCPTFAEDSRIAFRALADIYDEQISDFQNLAGPHTCSLNLGSADGNF